MKEYKGFDRNFRLDGKVAVITGGASGLGTAIAEMFDEKGAQVVLFDLSPKVGEVAASISEKAVGLRVDITDADAVNAAVEEVVKQFSRIDILANIAGLGDVTPAVDITREAWDKIVAVNLTALFFMSQTVGRHMIENNVQGKIINMASDAAVVGLYGHGHYGPTKAGVDNLTKVLANEWGPYGINVNAISPTVALTPMGKEFWVGEVADEMLAKIPMGRFVYPDEVAACALFLASDASDMVSGHNLVIDGAFTVC